MARNRRHCDICWSLPVGGGLRLSRVGETSDAELTGGLLGAIARVSQVIAASLRRLAISAPSARRKSDRRNCAVCAAATAARRVSRSQKAGMMPAFCTSHGAYCAGAGWAGGGSAGFVASGAGCIGCSFAGGLVLCVVVASPPVPLSLQAATPSRASAEADARMSFFMTSLL